MSAAPIDAAIKIEQVTKRYGDFTAVDNLTFTVQCSEIFAVLGPNGAGKTTTIRMILDILKPDAGSIAILGGPISDATKERIGYLPEERGLYRDVKVIDVLVYLGQLKGLSRHDAHQRAIELLEHVELGDNIQSKVKELSKGMQQKVQIITTILHRPDLVIIDEPFAGLDPVNTQLVKDLLYEMNRDGVTIVMSTHQMHQVEEMADRLLMISQGKRVLYGEVNEVRQRFAENSVIVEGEGDWSRLPGVTVEHRPDNGQGTILRLQEGVTPSDVMQAIASGPDYRVSRFEINLPSLNEIFINVAGESRNNVLNGGSV